MNFLKENNTWVLKRTTHVFKLSKDWKPISYKWVFQTKKNTQGQVVHHKARLKVMQQKHGIVFNDMSGLMVKFTSIKVLLAIVAINVLEIY
jgi:hypothetical protein